MKMIELNKIYCLDCLEGMKQMEDNSVDLVLTDPPYGIDYHSNHGSDKYKQRVHSHTWDKDFDFSIYFSECWRILKNNSYMLVFGRKENWVLMEELGCKQILVWNKQHNGMGNLKSWGIGYEFIFCFEKGSPSLKGGIRVNGVIDFKHVGFFDKTVHPTQKPVGLIKYLLIHTSNPDDLIFDPFLGSGTTAVACKQLNRDFIGFEINQDYVDITNRRLAQTVMSDFTVSE